MRPQPALPDFHDNVCVCVHFRRLLDLGMSAVNLARLLSCCMTDLQPCSFSSSSNADSFGLFSSSGWEQLGGLHVANTLLICVCGAEISVTTMSISVMCQLDIFIVVSNGAETNGYCGRKKLVFCCLSKHQFSN